MKFLVLLMAGTTAVFAGCTGGEDVDGDGTIDNPTGSRSVTHNLVNGIIGVPAGNWQYYTFTMNPGFTARVEGEFYASGGSGNDIVVLVMDELNYINWQNGHSVQTYYNSGQVTVGEISAYITQAGTYYLVYDNTFSTFSDKSVNTQANAVVS